MRTIAGNLKDVDQRLLRDPKRLLDLPNESPCARWQLRPKRSESRSHKGVARYLSIPLSRSRLIEE